MEQPGTPKAPGPPPPPTAFGEKKESWRKTAGLVAVLAVCGWSLFFGGRWLAGIAAGWLPYSVDRSIGEMASTAQLADSDVCDNPVLLEAVGAIVTRLESGLEDEYKPLHVVVVNDESVNAFALPGGYIFVMTGILDEIDAPEELIGVLGHEIGHAVHRHGIRRIAQSMWFSFLISQLTGGMGDFAEGAAGQAIGLLSLSFDRDQERESDEYGLQLMSDVGYEAGAFPNFFERLPDQGVPEWFSTHPNPTDRADELREKIEQMRSPANPIAPPLLDALKAPCHVETGVDAVVVP